jgi:hypothetical protein
VSGESFGPKEMSKLILWQESQKNLSNSGAIDIQSAADP